ncbi:hypothetical protein H5410_064588, partial [Solanum commersonii]
MKALIWNIRSVKSQHAFQRVQMLHNVHNFSFIGLLEPFQHSRHINKYRRISKMPQGISNYFDSAVIKDSEQQFTLLLKHHIHAQSFFVTLIYAKCREEERLMIWEDMYQLALGMDIPWLIEGDFNIILNSEEKIGGLPVLDSEHEDFENYISSCDLEEIHFKGSPFTWWNSRAGNASIFERLDRVLTNQRLQ